MRIIIERGGGEEKNERTGCEEVATWEVAETEDEEAMLELDLEVTGPITEVRILERMPGSESAVAVGVFLSFAGVGGVLGVLGGLGVFVSNKRSYKLFFFLIKRRGTRTT